MVSDPRLPVPVRLMVCGLPVALSFTFNVAEREPLAVGLKVTVTRQVASGLMLPELGHVLAELIWKSPGLAPVSVRLVMFNATVRLVSVRMELSAALVEPTVVDGKLNVPGSSVAVALDPPVPVPVRLTVCGLPVALSFTLSVAERAPLAVGENVTDTRHVASGLTVPELGHVLAEVILKSPGLAPVRLRLVMFKASVVLVSVRVELWAALVDPTATEPKLRLAGSNVAVGPVAAAPVPVRLMVCLPALVLSVTVNVAERDPVAVGVKVTVMRHVPSGLTVPELGQVLAELI